MARTTEIRSDYFMRDQVKGKVRGLMDESWFNSPWGALFTLVALVTALSVLGGLGTAEAMEGRWQW